MVTTPIYSYLQAKEQINTQKTLPEQGGQATTSFCFLDIRTRVWREAKLREAKVPAGQDLAWYR